MAGWWKFEEGSGKKVADSSGSNNHGAVVGKPVWSRGTNGGAMIFGGRDDAVVIPNSPSVERVQEGEYSISAWALPEDIPSARDSNSRTYYIMAKTGFHEEGVCCGQAANFAAMHMLGDDTWGSVCPSTPIAPGVARHVAMTVSRTEATGAAVCRQNIGGHPHLGRSRKPSRFHAGDLENWQRRPRK